MDVICIGGGFGGLGAALAAAEDGAKVLLLEGRPYPGGCASTFVRGGLEYEAGATLVSGLGDGQYFSRIIDRYGLDVEIESLDPVIHFRCPSFRMELGSAPEALRDAFLGMRGAPHAALQDFFALQRRVADPLWSTLEELPLMRGSLWRALRRIPRFLPLLPYMGRPLGSVLRRKGLAKFRPLVTCLDALCQITLQCSASEAETPLALAAMDYCTRGAAHVKGGIGRLARGMVAAIESRGGRVLYGHRAIGLRQDREARTWSVETRRGTFQARQVFANLLPQALQALLERTEGRIDSLDRMSRDVEGGWGACMLYLRTEGQAKEGAPAHIQVVQNEEEPFVEGNHLFCSRSGESVTVSTHVKVEKADAAYIEAVQNRMRAGLERFVPEWAAGPIMTASPRTFERFTGRPRGFVGGVPRRASLSHYRIFRSQGLPDGLFLVGDTIFPGQSALAAALGGNAIATLAR